MKPRGNPRHVSRWWGRAPRPAGQPGGKACAAGEAGKPSAGVKPGSTEGLDPAAFLPPQELEARAHFSLQEDENTLLVGARRQGDWPRDREAYDREALQEECLEAWRFNPLARRIVELTGQYVAGGGMVVRCAHAGTDQFLQSFWAHPLNHLESRLTSFSDELALSGNLFLLLSTDRAGMSYVRVVPSASITHIISRPNDVEQELWYFLRSEDSQEDKAYPAAYPPPAPGADGLLPPVMLHFAVNRPAGAQWGESDLAPVLKWLSRYNAWLEDRVRLNRFRNAFVYVVKARFASEGARASRQMQLAANPPGPGSVLVTDEGEEWSVLSPRLEALDASTDGLALKKMIAAGAGIPLHFLAEPESSTRTTAEAAGTPTYRRYEERQRFLCLAMEELLQVAVSRARSCGQALPAAPLISVRGGDISARDNSELAQAGKTTLEAAQALFAQGLIDGRELRRLVYRFLGERLPED